LGGALHIAFVEERLADAIAVAEVLDYVRLLDRPTVFRSDMCYATELGLQLLNVPVECRAIVVSEQHHCMKLAPIGRLPLLGGRIAEFGAAHAFRKSLRKLPLRIAEVFVALGREVKRGE
jgi:hypothetical protein